MKKRYKYAFTRQEGTEGGYASVLFAVLSLAVFLIAAGISIFYKGNAESWLGALGVMAVLLSAYGFYIGFESFRERDKNYRNSVLGALSNGILLVGWLALFLIGI